MKQHWLAIILAVVTGLIVGLPHVLIPKIIAPQKYDPLQFLDGKGSSITMEEVYTYVPEVREILEGKFWVTDTQVAEYNGQPTPFAGETGLAWIMAALVKLTGSMQNAFMAADFLFPAVTFLLVYAIVLLGWPRPANGGPRNDGRVLAAATGVVVVLWPELVVLFPYPNVLISAAKAAFDPRDFLFMSRNFHPQLSLPAYLFAFWLLIKALEGEKEQKDKKDKGDRILINLGAGVAVGFLFYTYIFNWTAFGLGFALFFLLILLRILLAEVRKRSDLPRSDLGRSDLMKLLIIFAVAGLVAAPYFLQVWEFRQSGLAEDFFLKLSLPKRGFFDLTARHWIFAIFYIFALFHWKSDKDSPCRGKESPLRNALFLSFWIAPLILPDLMQNILGRDLEGKHWVRRIAYPFEIMGLSIAVSQILNKKWIKLICLPLILLVLSYGLIRQTKMSYKIYDAYSQIPEKQELYDWINQNAPSGAVIASLDWETIVNIPAKTHAFNFSPIGMRTIASTDETLDRFLWAVALYGKSEDWVKEAFGENGIGTTRVYYFMYANDEAVFRLPQDKVEEIVSRYRDIRQRLAAGEKPPFRLMLQLEK